MDYFLSKNGYKESKDLEKNEMKQYIVDAFTDKPFSGNPVCGLRDGKLAVRRVHDEAGYGEQF